MTASRFDPPVRRALGERGLIQILLVPLIGALAACRAGLPPEPPGADPADANAAAPAYQVEANPYEVSAFADAPAGASTEHAGHEHMGHGAKAGEDHSGHMGHDAKAGEDHSGHMGHGTKAGEDHSGHTGHGKPATEEPVPATPANPGHAGHGTMSAPKAEAVPANPPKQEAPR